MNTTLFLKINTCINFLFLISSLWLGLHVVLRDPKARDGWLLSCTLWSLSGYFLNNLTFLHHLPGEGGLPWWWGWSVALAAPFWFHLSVEMLPEDRRQKQRTMVIAMYFLTLNLVAMEAYTPLIFIGARTGSPALYDFQEPGRIFPLYGLFLVLAPALSLWNFRSTRRICSNALLRRQITLLQIASLLAVSAGLYAGLSIWLRWKSPTLFATLLLGASVLMIADGVVRWNTALQGRVHRQNFLYAAVSTGLLVAGYLLIAVLSNLVFDVPFIAFVFLVCFAIITHALYDYGLGTLDSYFSSRREHRALRRSLRDLTKSSILTTQDMNDRLQGLLTVLCKNLGVQEGWIQLHQGEVSILAATVADLPAGLKTPGVKDVGIRLDEEQDPSLLVVPLQYAGAQLGNMVLRSTTGGTPFSERELEAVEDCADRVASLLHILVLQKESISHLKALTQQLRQQEQTLQAQMRHAHAREGHKHFPGEREGDNLYPLVEDALQHMDDYSYLGQHNLAHLKIVSARLEEMEKNHITHLERGKALHALLQMCIEKLKPNTARMDPPGPSWRPYLILQNCYLRGKRTRDMMGVLYISEATFHRTRRRAIRAVAQVITELERHALPSQDQTDSH